MTESGRSWTDEFIALRPLLFSLSYRMTGSVTDAEDIVSEAYLRLRRAVDGGTKITSLKTYLSSVVTRLSIDHLRSARMRREAYVGPWLPEPLIGTDSQADFERVEIADSLSMAFLVLLETLTPTERAVFLLREVFEFDYPRIAGMLGKSEPYCRQLLSRARQHVEARKPRFDADERERRRLAVRFFDAVEAGDLEPLVTMLADDVVTYGDAGGDGPLLLLPVNGRDKVLGLLAVLSDAIREFDLHVEHVPVNGQPGVLVRDSRGLLLSVLVVDILDGAVQTMRSILNPDKLRHLGPLVGPEHPLRGGGRERAGR